MKTSDYVSTVLSVTAIIISVFVWRTTDTRASELREKVIRYSVEAATNFSTYESSTKQKKTKASEDIFDVDGKLIERIDTVKVAISNTGKLPTKDVTITIPTRATDGKIPPYRVELTPATDYEPTVRGSSLVIHIKNPLGPQSNLEVIVKFDTVKKGREAAKDFGFSEPFVDSEVGGAIRIGSQITGSSNSPY